MNLPQYQTRYSKKAKYLQLKLTDRGLQVIIPHRQKLTPSQIEMFLHEKRNWLVKHQEFIAACAESQTFTLPTSIDLKAITELWQVKYLATANRTLKMIANPQKELTLIGDMSNQTKCLLNLRQWLKEKAKQHLYEQLSLLARETNLVFKHLIIRNNQTRWGSCSSDGTISLCYKILFLARHHMRHILLHELCHTREMNHGRRFWAMMMKFDPAAKQHAREINSLYIQIPRWVCVGRSL